ncbi:hypothetical protein HHK36_012123 [Tetracentron sinense]|uniref:Uncharacterized protein n=1 Tax=Tetracentron sinense TaxID=13715 RepID=A0A835DHS9_TETSI|nr:hypothetical protein HHK36_012123 [Tetracentron sinense]
MDVRGVLWKTKPDIIAIKETKLEEMNDLVVSEMWDNRQVDWMFVESVGASRGQLVKWDHLVFEKVEALLGEFSISIRFRGVEEEFEWLFTAVLKYVEQELAKKRGMNINATDQVENDLKRAEDELYVIPEHLKVKKRNSEESSTQWTTGIAEVQLPIEYKLRNIEETEAAKKLLQDKRLVGRSKAELSIPSSYSADYFQRGRDYAEKLRREHPELYKDRAVQENGAGPRQADTANTEAAGRRQAATDEFMLERFRKRERHRGMRR